MYLIVAHLVSVSIQEDPGRDLASLDIFSLFAGVC